MSSRFAFLAFFLFGSLDVLLQIRIGSDSTLVILAHGALLSVAVSLLNFMVLRLWCYAADAATDSVGLFLVCGLFLTPAAAIIGISGGDGPRIGLTFFIALFTFGNIFIEGVRHLARRYDV